MSFPVVPSKLGAFLFGNGLMRVAGPDRDAEHCLLFGNDDRLIKLPNPHLLPVSSCLPGARQIRALYSQLTNKFYWVLVTK